MHLLHLKRNLQNLNQPRRWMEFRLFKGGVDSCPPFSTPETPNHGYQVRQAKLRLCLPTYRDTFVASAVGSIFLFVSWRKFLRLLGWKDVFGPGCSRTGEKQTTVRFFRQKSPCFANSFVSPRATFQWNFPRLCKLGDRNTAAQPFWNLIEST